MNVPNFENVRVVDEKGMFTPDWRQIFTQLFIEMQSNLSDQGVFVPKLTPSEITSLNTPESTAAIIYNSTTNKGMINENGVFKTINTGTVIDEFIAPLVYDPLTEDVSIPQATSTIDGYLSSADWIIFNSKEPAITPGTSLQYYRGDKTWQTLDTLAVTENTNLYYLDSRARAALGNSSPITYSSSTGVIGITQATTTTDGYLSSTDWNMFNGKEAVLTFSYPLNRATNTISLLYNNTNLKINGSNQLDTIQDISTTSSPQFAGLGLGVAPFPTSLLNASISGASVHGIDLYIYKDYTVNTAMGINVIGSMPGGASSGTVLNLIDLNGTGSVPGTLTAIDINLSGSASLNGIKMALASSGSGFSSSAISATWTATNPAVSTTFASETIAISTWVSNHTGVNISMTDTGSGFNTNTAYNASITQNNSGIFPFISKAYGFKSNVVNSNATYQCELYALHATISPNLTNDLAYGLYLDNAKTAALNDPTTFQVGIYINRNGIGTDANNKKWAFYNATPDATSGKVLLGINNVPTFWGTTFNASQYFDGTNFNIKVTDAYGIIIATNTAQKIGFFGATPVLQQTGGAATAGATYTSNEQDMINRMYTALQNYGLLT